MPVLRFTRPSSVVGNFLAGVAVSALIAVMALALAAGFSLARAADLAKPPASAIDAESVRDEIWNGCYLEAGGSVNAFIQGSGSTRTYSVVGGAGCNTKVAMQLPIVVGAFVRYGFNVSDAKQGATVFELREPVTTAGRVGYLLRPMTLAYAFAGYSWPLKGANDFAGPVGGIGLEVKLFEQISFATEYAQSYPTNGGRTQSVTLTFRKSF